MLIQQIIYGLIAIIIGVVTLKYNYEIVNNTSRLQSIESVLGSGSTYFIYKLVSILLILGGIIYMTGFSDTVLGWVTTPLLNLFPH